MSRSVGWGLLLGVLVAPIPAAAPPATVALLCVGACPAPPFDAGLPMFVSTLRDAGYARLTSRSSSRPATSWS
jgi:hypothetical protein